MSSRTMMILFFGALITVVGCAENKLNRHNYDTIYVGKSNKTEVRMTMGDDHLVDRGDEWEYEDWDRKLSVVFHFDQDGKVSRKQWRDAKTDEWHDTKDEPEGEKVHDASSNMTIDKG